MHRKMWAVGAAALLVVLLAGCTDDGGDADATPQPTTTAPPTTEPESTTTVPDDETQLRQLAEDWFEVSPTLFSPEGVVSVANEYLVDPYLAQVQEQVDDYDERGVEVEVTDASSIAIESIEVDGDSAVLVECIVDGDHLVDTATGEILDESVIAFRTETYAARTDDGWRLAERTRSDEFEGASSCDAA